MPTDRLTVAMAGAMASVANGAPLGAAAAAAGVTRSGLEKALERAGLRVRSTCPACGRSTSRSVAKPAMQ